MTNQQYAVMVCRLMVATLVIAWITTHLPTLEGWKAEFAWLVDPLWTPYPRSGHMSTIDQAQIRESPPADVLTTEPRHQQVYIEPLKSIHF